jgi:hypothetical protein
VLQGRFAPHAPERWGRIVNVASVAAKRISFTGAASYTASKAGLLGVTRHLAYEVVPPRHQRERDLPGPDDDSHVRAERRRTDTTGADRPGPQEGDGSPPRTMDGSRCSSARRLRTHCAGSPSMSMAAVCSGGCRGTDTWPSVGGSEAALNRAQRSEDGADIAHCALRNLDTFATMIKEQPEAVFILADLMRARQAK